MTILTIILGVLLVIASIVCLLNPVLTAVAIGLWLAVALLVGGVSDMINSIRTKRSGYGWFIALDVISILVGISILGNDFGTIIATNALITIMGVLILIDGIARIPLAFEMKKQGESWGLVLASGILSIIAAIFILSSFLTGLFVADIMISSAIMVQGITMITNAITGRSQGGQESQED